MIQPRKRSGLGMLVFLTSTMAMIAADKSASWIKWLPVPEHRDPSTISQWKAAVLQIAKPLRKKLFAAPKRGAFYTLFYSCDIEQLSNLILPNAISTNSDGVMAAGLSPDQFAKFHGHVNVGESFTLESLNQSVLVHGSNTRIWNRRFVRMNGTNAVYGLSIELQPHVNNDVVFIRSIAEMTEPVTNRFRANSSSTGVTAVTIEPVYHYALDVNIPDGGALVIWRAKTNDLGNLIVIIPKVHASHQQ